MFIFTLFFISTGLVLRITDSKWEGVSVCKKKASCSRKKENIHQNKQQTLLNHCFFVRDQLNYSVIQKSKIKKYPARPSAYTSPDRLIL